MADRHRLVGWAPHAEGGQASVPSWANGLGLTVRRFLLIAVIFANAMSGPGAIAATPADLDEHVNRLTAELRCLVCQNQTIADSQAELALQLKAEVRKQLSHGATDEQVLDFMVQRYGDFVLYRPPVNRSTWLLWGGPALLLSFAGVLARLHWRERRAAFQNAPDSELSVDVEEVQP